MIRIARIFCFLFTLFTITSLNAQSKLPWVQVKGPWLINDKGDTIVFHGLSIADPDKIKDAGKWSKHYFDIIKSWGADIVRIPVHPRAWRKRGDEAYLKMLDEAVKWCGDLGMYVIIDWHSMGNLDMEIFQDPMYDTTQKETYNFWRAISQRYKDDPTVAFLEFFNEPTTSSGQFGTCTWADWSRILLNCIDLVRANGSRAIPLVAGFNWAYDLMDVNHTPVPRTGIAYAAHPYPGKNPGSKESNWDTHFGFVASISPVIATEVGFTFNANGSAPLPDDGVYSKTLLPYLEKKHISWCAWVFDPNWEPAMLKDWEGTPTAEGDYWKKALLKK